MIALRKNYHYQMIKGTEPLLDRLPAKEETEHLLALAEELQLEGIWSGCNCSRCGEKVYNHNFVEVRRPNQPRDLYCSESCYGRDP